MSISVKVFHGTPNLNGFFNETGEFHLDPNKTGFGNDDIGSGFYFTNQYETALGYAKDVSDSNPCTTIDEPGILTVELELKNPIIIRAGQSLEDIETQLSFEQIKSIIKKAPRLYNLDESPVGDTLDIWSEGEVTEEHIDTICSYYTKGCTLFSLENDFFGEYGKESAIFREAYREATGIDGVVMEFRPVAGKSQVHYSAWFPDQVKLIEYENLSQPCSTLSL